MSIDQQIEQFIEAQRGRRAGSVPLRQCLEVKYRVFFKDATGIELPEFDYTTEIGPDVDIIKNWRAS